MHDTLPWKGMCAESCDPFKFWEISDSISLMVRDRDIIAIEQQLEIVRGLSNVTTADALK